MTDQPDPIDVGEVIQGALTRDSHGGFVTGWLLVAVALDVDGQEKHHYYASENQGLVESRGLAETLLDRLKYEQWRALQEMDE